MGKGHQIRTKYKLKNTYSKKVVNSVAYFLDTYSYLIEYIYIYCIRVIKFVWVINTNKPEMY